MSGLPVSAEPCPITIQRQVRHLWNGEQCLNSTLPLFAPDIPCTPPSRALACSAPSESSRARDCLRLRRHDWQQGPDEHAEDHQGPRRRDARPHHPSMLKGAKGVPPSDMPAMQKHARKQGSLYTTLREFADLSLPPSSPRPHQAPRQPTPCRTTLSVSDCWVGIGRSTGC